MPLGDPGRLCVQWLKFRRGRFFKTTNWSLINVLPHELVVLVACHLNLGDDDER